MFKLFRRAGASCNNFSCLGYESLYVWYLRIATVLLERAFIQLIISNKILVKPVTSSCRNGLEKNVTNINYNLASDWG